MDDGFLANVDDGFLAYTDVVLEQQYLPPAVADFFLVALTWCMVGWALRLAYIAMSLIELRHAIDQNRVSVHGDVPLHALVPGRGEGVISNCPEGFRQMGSRC